MSNEWQEWGGGKCPVEDHVVVDIRWRDGDEEEMSEAYGWDWNWSGINEGTEDWEIIAWRLHVSEEDIQISDKPSGPVVSSGGSSSYYTFPITNKAGETIVVETQDVIRCMVGDNFSLGNVVKACRRMWEESQGRGKAGGSLDYDANKNDYFSKEFAHWYNKGK